jgi:phage tail-like protein
MTANDNNYIYLNRDPAWADFQMDGLEVRADGVLQLNSVPLFDGDLPPELKTIGSPSAPAGLAVDVEGSIYFSNPGAGGLWRVDGCDEKMRRVLCIRPGNRSGEVKEPRGLLIPKRRHALFVSDSRNHRVLIFDLDTFTPVEVWGQDDLASAPKPSADPGKFNEPWALAGDSTGNVYVIDHGNHRVQKFNLSGDVVPEFWTTLSHEAVLSEPSDIACGTHTGRQVLFVVDRSAGAVFVVNLLGNVVRDDHGHPLTFGRIGMEPMGIATASEAIYVGDNARRRILTFESRAGEIVFAGEAVGYRGPIAALAIDQREDLLVHSGGDLEPLRLDRVKGFQRRGIFWSKPITPAVAEVKWHRLAATVAELAQSAHIQLFLHTADEILNAPADPQLDSGDTSNSFADPKWQPMPLDVADLLITGVGRYTWIGAVLSGNGMASPAVSQVRLEFNHQGYEENLPAIYRNRPACNDFLPRLLALCESFFVELEKQIEELPVFFDPAATPFEFLPWLAGWLALELDEKWSEAEQRTLIQQAFSMYGRRGTVEGLREALRIFAGVEAVIEEPLLNAAWWALPSEKRGCRPEEACADAREKNWQGAENSILGVTTMLVPAEAQGAVVGTTAVLDRSHLIGDEEFAVPLFEDVAHQFTVLIRRSQLGCAETMGRVRRVLDGEKPAHTLYHLCVIEPRMRVGYQARVGVDSVIGGPPVDLRLNQGLLLGDAGVGGRPAGHIGEQSRVGIETRIG